MKYKRITFVDIPSKSPNQEQTPKAFFSKKYKIFFIASLIYHFQNNKPTSILEINYELM